jgi:hypothetical protein
MHRFTAPAALTGLALAAAPLASAELLLYEGFDYDTGTDSLVGESGGFGFGPTAYTEGGTANNLQNAGVTAAANLVFSDFTATGNVAQIQNNNNDSTDGDYKRHYATRLLPALSITPGSTVYSSFLYRQEKDASFAHEAELAFGDAAGGRDRLRQITVDLFDTNGADEVAVGYDSSTVLSGSTPSANKQPLLFITRFENVNGTGNQTASMYVLSEADYDSIKAGGITQAELDTLGAAATDTATGVTFGTADYLTLTTTTAFGIQNNSYFDEFRLFTDLDDLQAVPEPASATLLAAGGLLALRRRRR